MKPWAGDDRAVLYHGDSLRVLAELPGATVDAVVTDPPYNLSDSGKRDADCLGRVAAGVRRSMVVALLLVGYSVTAPGFTTKPAVPLGEAAHAPTAVGPRAPAPDAADYTRTRAGTRVHAGRASRASRPTPSPSPPSDPLLEPFLPLTERHLAALRRCENGGRYTSAPGDRYRGAYQAWPDTWRRLWLRFRRPAYAALDPAAAPRRVQDAFARLLHRVAGRGQWPVCGRSLP